MRWLGLLCCLLLALACSSPSGHTATTQVKFSAKQHPNFGAYWYTGQAEMSRYQLEQAHYGALYPGETVLIFVTEDFLTKAQVKRESATSDASTPVLKLNASRKFITGIYDYSLFTSVFTPIQSDQFGHTLKVTTSVQDWCGQTFHQLNLRSNEYQVLARSYFQAAGDEDYAVKTAVLEDEIWNRIRLHPQSLPQGEVRVIPGTATARLRHQRLAPRDAKGELKPYSGGSFTASQPGDSLLSYTLTYADRSLHIVFEKAFPYLIAGWEETYQSGSKKLTTRAIRTHTKRTDYWTKNTPADSTRRKEMGIRIGLQEDPVAK
jgi:hypothetical protein